MEKIDVLRNLITTKIEERLNELVEYTNNYDFINTEANDLLKSEIKFLKSLSKTVKDDILHNKPSS